MSLNLKSLIGKVDDATRNALEAAAGLCVSRTHYDIEIEHYLLKAIDSSDNDLALILRQYGVDRSRLTNELQRSLDKLKTGNARSPAFSPLLVKMLTEAWTGHHRIRCGPDSHRFHTAGPAFKRRASAARPRRQQRAAIDSGRRFAHRLLCHY